MRLVVNPITGEMDVTYHPQNLDTAASPTFAALSLGTGELTADSINSVLGPLTLEVGGTAQITLTSTLATFINAVTAPQLFNTAGDLKIQPDIQGDVHIFGDTDVGNLEDGKSLYVNRKAAEGDNYIRMYVNQFSNATFLTGGSMRFQSSSGGDITFFSADDLFFDTWTGGYMRFRDHSANILVTIVESTGFTGMGEVAPETLLELTHATPYITLHNDTHEDTDGGRESRLIFKGEQSGGEEATLGYIEFSHDGTGDDEKGKYLIYVNDGNDGAAPTLRMQIDSAGGVFHVGLKSGATQAAAGAAASELWITASHATLPDNVVMMGA